MLVPALSSTDLWMLMLVSLIFQPGMRNKVCFWMAETNNQVSMYVQKGKLM